MTQRTGLYDEDGEPLDASDALDYLEDEDIADYLREGEHYVFSCWEDVVEAVKGRRGMLVFDSMAEAAEYLNDDQYYAFEYDGVASFKTFAEMVDGDGNMKQLVQALREEGHLNEEDGSSDEIPFKGGWLRLIRAGSDVFLDDDTGYTALHITDKGIERMTGYAGRIGHSGSPQKVTLVGEPATGDGGWQRLGSTDLEFRLNNQGGSHHLWLEERKVGGSKNAGGPIVLNGISKQLERMMDYRGGLKREETPGKYPLVFVQGVTAAKAAATEDATQLINELKPTLTPTSDGGWMAMAEGSTAFGSTVVDVLKALQKKLQAEEVTAS